MAIDLNSILSLLQDDGTPEHWVRQLPVMGDHIRVRRLGGLYYHHGIYVSDDEVIAFAGDDDYNPIDWWDTEIRATSFEEFRQGGDVEVQYAKIGEDFPDADWPSWVEAGNSTQAVIPGLLANRAYRIRARAVQRTPLVRGKWSVS